MRSLKLYADDMSLSLTDVLYRMNDRVAPSDKSAFAEILHRRLTALRRTRVKIGEVDHYPPSM